MVGMVHEEINLKSTSGIIHAHLIELVRYKQTPKRIFRMSRSAINKFLQNLKMIYFSKFSTAALMCSLKWCSLKCSGKLATGTALLLW